LTAARKGETQVSARDFEEALDWITLGAEGPPLMDAQERRLVAYHEGGMRWWPTCCRTSIRCTG
jgi:cell division protease FtsH